MVSENRSDKKIMPKAPGRAGIFTRDNGHFELQGPCLIRGRYSVIEVLDSNGQSAVLVLAEDVSNARQLVVIKVMHAHLYEIGVQESHVLMELAALDPNNLAHTVRLLTTVVYGSHYCLVLEPLLPDPLTTVFSTLPDQKRLVNMRKVGLRLLACIGFLHQHNMIHTDLKPENMLLKDESDLDSVHIVDFGSAVHDVEREVALYYKDFQLQTPLYRAPEVVFGVSLGREIDMWSLGCVLAELFLGERLFLGDTIEEILTKIKDILGPFPSSLFRRGKFFRKYQHFTGEAEPSNGTLKLLEVLQCEDILFADLLTGLLKFDPAERLTASEAACHPFFASYFPVAFLLPDNRDKMAVSKGGLCPDSPITSPRAVTDSRTHKDTPIGSRRAHKATPTEHHRTNGATSTEPSRTYKVTSTESHKTNKVTPTELHRTNKVTPIESRRTNKVTPTDVHRAQQSTTSMSDNMHKDTANESTDAYKAMPTDVRNTRQVRATESGRASKPILSGMNETFVVKQEINDDTFVLKPERKFTSHKQSNLSQEYLYKDLKPSENAEYNKVGVTKTRNMNDDNIGEDELLRQRTVYNDDRDKVQHKKIESNGHRSNKKLNLAKSNTPDGERNSQRKPVVTTTNTTCNTSAQEQRDKLKRPFPSSPPSKDTHASQGRHLKAKRKLIEVEELTSGISNVYSNSDDPDETAPAGAVSSGAPQFAKCGKVCEREERRFSRKFDDVEEQHDISADDAYSSDDQGTYQRYPHINTHKTSTNLEPKRSENLKELKTSEVDRLYERRPNQTGNEKISKESDAAIKYRGSQNYHQLYKIDNVKRKKSSPSVKYQGTPKTHPLNKNKAGDPEMRKNTSPVGTPNGLKMSDRRTLNAEEDPYTDRYSDTESHASGVEVRQRPGGHLVKVDRHGTSRRGLQTPESPGTSRRSSDQMRRTSVGNTNLQQGTSRKSLDQVPGTNGTVEDVHQRLDKRFQSGSGTRRNVETEQQGTGRVSSRASLQNGTNMKSPENSSRHYAQQRSCSITSGHQQVTNTRSPRLAHETKRRSANEIQETIDKCSNSKQGTKRRFDVHEMQGTSNRYSTSNQGAKKRSYCESDGGENSGKVGKKCRNGNQVEQEDQYSYQQPADNNDESLVDLDDINSEEGIDTAGFENDCIDNDGDNASFGEDYIEEPDEIIVDKLTDLSHGSNKKTFTVQRQDRTQTGARNRAAKPAWLHDDSIDKVDGISSGEDASFHRIAKARSQGKGRDVNHRQAAKVRSTGTSKAGNLSEAVYRNVQSSSQHGNSTEDVGGSCSTPEEDNSDQPQERAEKSRDQHKAVYRDDLLEELDGNNSDDYVHEERNRKMSAHKMLKQQIAQKRQDGYTQHDVEMDILQSIAVKRNRLGKQNSWVVGGRFTSPEHVRSPTYTRDNGKASSNNSNTHSNEHYDNTELPTSMPDGWSRVLSQEPMLTNRRPSANRHSDPLIIKTEPLSSSVLTDQSSECLSGDEEYVDLLSPVIHNNRAGRTLQHSEKSGSQRSLKRTLEEASDILQVSRGRSPSSDQNRGINNDRNKCLRTDTRAYR